MGDPYRIRTTRRRSGSTISSRIATSRSEKSGRTWYGDGRKCGPKSSYTILWRPWVKTSRKGLMRKLARPRKKPKKTPTGKTKSKLTGTHDSRSSGATYKDQLDPKAKDTEAPHTRVGGCQRALEQ